MRWLRLACVAAGAALLVCLGLVHGSSAAAASNGVRSTTPHAEAAPARQGKRRVLRGTKRVKRFALARRDTLVVTGTLRLTASESITIAGRVVVSPGAGLSLRSGGTLKLARGSSIAPAPARRAASASVPAGSGAPPLVVLQGDRADIEGSVRTMPGQSVQILVNERGTVDIAGTIRTGDGDDGAHAADAGGDGGSIIVSGGVFGNAKLIRLGRLARLETGDGGHGFDNARGQLQGTENPCNDAHADPPGGANRRRLFVEATDGGKGGTVRLLARTYDLKGRVEVGDGGRGGHAGFAPGRERLKAPNGTPGHGGVDVYAQAGSGGDGGSFDAPGKPAAAQAGAGGNGGSVRVAAGDGAANCDGGRTEPRLGLSGKRGRRGAKPDGETEAGSIELAGGGHGGDASDRDHSGGNGGLVRLENAGAPEDPITVSEYANGGAGFDGCGASPAVGGTAGGAGGVVRAGTKHYAVGRAFLGGRGGNGLPAGVGGAAGTQDLSPLTSLDSFRAGGSGDLCPGAAYRFEASNVQIGWVSPFTGQNVTGTYALSFCGSNPFAQAWSYSGTVTDGPFGFSGGFRFDVSPFMPVRGYNDLSGNPVATVGVRFALGGAPPTLTLAPTVVITGSTSVVNPGPQTVELVGRLVTGC